MPQLVLAEAGYLVGKLVTPEAEARFVRELADSPFVFHPSDPDELRRAADLMETYADLRLGTVDAAVIAAAERLGAHTIATLDRRHFSVVRPIHVDAFELVP